MSKTIFISDLHLTEDQENLTQLFLKFIDYCLAENQKAKESNLELNPELNPELNQDSKIDSIYILGDFFNYWIGNDAITPWHNTLITAFEKLSKITKIYFLVGNRDFQVNAKTAEIFHFELIKDDVKKLSLYGQDLLILHGDTLCTDDLKYQKFRKIARNPLLKKLYLWLPLKLRNNIALGIKKQSKRNSQAYNVTPEIFDVTDTAVAELFDTYQCNTIIHGHTHKPQKHEYPESKYRYVLGDWHADGAIILEITDNQPNKFNLIHFA